MPGILDAIEFKVDADTTPFATKLGTLVGQAKVAATKMSQGFGQVAKGIGSMATKVAAVGGLLGGVAVKGASSFEAAMLRAKTMTDLTKDEFEQLVTEVRKLAVAEGATDFDALGDTVFTAFSSGAKDMAEALDLTELSLKNLNAQGTEASTTIKFLTQQQKVWKGEAGDNSDLMDKLAAAVLKAKDTQEGFASSLEDITPLAKASGVTVDELFGIVADLSQSLNSAGKASTAFKEVMNANLTPTKLQAEAIDLMNQGLLEQAGLTEDELSKWESREQAAKAMNVQLVQFGQGAIAAAGGLQAWLASIAKGMAATDGSTRRLVRSVEGFNALLTFTDDNGAALGETIDFIADSSGRFQRQYDDMNASFALAWSEAWANLRELGLALVIDTGLLDDLKAMLAKAVETMGAWSTQLAAFIKTNPDAVQQIKDQVFQWAEWTLKIAGVSVAMTFLAPLVTVVSGVVKLMGLAWAGLSKLWVFVLVPAAKAVGAVIAGLSWPVLLIGGAVVGLATTFAVYFDEITDTVGEWSRSMHGFVTEVFGFFKWLVDGFGALGEAVYDSITGWFGDAADWVISKWQSVYDWFASTWLGDALGFAAAGAVPVPSNVPGYALGGYVQGRAGTDANLARLTKGEFVVNPTATAANRQLLEAINAGRPAAPSGRMAGGRTELHIHSLGRVDETLVREYLVPLLERIAEAGLSPRLASVL